MSGARLRRILLALFAVVCFLVLWRAAGSPLTPEDLHWLDRVVHGQPADAPRASGAHLLYLDAAVAVLGGSPFAGARAASALLMTVAVLALVVGAGALLPKRPTIGAVAAALVLLAQPFLLATTGSVRPELSAMAWIGIGLALALRHPTDRGDEGRFGRRHRDAFLLGAVTALAWRSDPSGAILLWLTPLLLRQGGRWLPRSSAGRVVAWLAGAVAAYALVDAGLLLVGGRSLEAGPVFVPASAAAGWVEVLWPGRVGTGGWGGGLRVLALLVVGAAVAAFATGRSLERRLIQMLPLVFVAGLLVGRLFTAAVPEPADLLPVIPSACLLGAALVDHVWRAKKSKLRPALPEALLPLAALAAVVLLIDPYLSGRLPAERLLPWLHPVTAADLTRRTFAPGLGLLLLIGAALALRSHRLRPAALLAIAIVALGPGLATSARLVANREPARRAAATLDPWRTFDRAIRAAAPPTLAVSPRVLKDDLQRADPAAVTPIARLCFGEPALEVGTDARALRKAEVVLVGADEANSMLADPAARVVTLERDDTRGLVLLRRGGDRPSRRAVTRERRRQERREDREEDAVAPLPPPTEPPGNKP